MGHQTIGLGWRLGGPLLLERTHGSGESELGESRVGVDVDRTEVVGVGGVDEADGLRLVAYGFISGVREVLGVVVGVAKNVLGNQVVAKVHFR